MINVWTGILPIFKHPGTEGEWRTESSLPVPTIYDSRLATMRSARQTSVAIHLIRRAALVSWELVR